MLSNLTLTTMFFNDLKKYNATNFRTIEKADLSKPDATVHKAFSSVITRYHIFCERHPEVSDMDKRILYFKLKIDMIGRYFSNYPDINTDELRPFQLELLNHIKETRGEDDGTPQTTTVSDIGMEAAAGM